MLKMFFFFQMRFAHPFYGLLILSEKNVKKNIFQLPIWQRFNLFLFRFAEFNGTYSWTNKIVFSEWTD